MYNLSFILYFSYIYFFLSDILLDAGKNFFIKPYL